MICPKCGTNVPDGPECAACGVVVKKFLARNNSPSVASRHSVPSKTSVSGSEPIANPSTGSSRVPDRKLAGVYRQMARMLDAGLSPTQALLLMVRATKGDLALALENIRESIEHGSSFSQAAANQPELFPHGAIAILQAGEATGGLPAALVALAASAEVRVDIKRQIVRACVYPFVLFTLVFFIPKAYLLFTVGVWGYILACMVPYLETLGVLIALVWLLPKLLSNLLGKEKISRLVRTIPVLRGLYTLSSKARFMEHLGAGLSSGLPIDSCLRLAASATSDPAWTVGMHRAQNMLKNGSTLSDALASTGLLDDEMLLCVASGERVGRLDESLQQESSLLQSSFLHRLNISMQILAVCILLATYFFVASAVVSEYEDVMNGAQTQLDQVLKEAGGGKAGGLDKLLKALGGSTNGVDLNKLLKGLDGAQGNDLERLLKQMAKSAEGGSNLPPDLKGVVP